METLTQQLKESNSKTTEAELKAAEISELVQRLQAELEDQKNHLEEQKKKADEVDGDRI